MTEGRQQESVNDDDFHPRNEQVTDLQRKREEVSLQAILALQEASKTVFKYCVNEDFRQTAMRLLEVEDWTHVPDASQSRWAPMAKKFHNVDMGNEVSEDADGTNPSSGRLDDSQMSEVMETEKDDFDLLAEYAAILKVSED